MTRLQPDDVLHMAREQAKSNPSTRIQTAFGVVEIVESKFLRPGTLVLGSDPQQVLNAMTDEHKAMTAIANGVPYTQRFNPETQTVTLTTQPMAMVVVDGYIEIRLPNPQHD